MKRIFSLALLATLSGCAGPTPFEYGEPVDPPWGCKDYRARGGYCSLQSVLDEVHAIYKPTPDEVFRPDFVPNFASGYEVEHWHVLGPSGRGDCEDFALTVRQYLNARGIYGTRLLQVEVNGKGHAALELDGWVMDNTSLFPRTRDELKDWTFIAGGDEDGVWQEVL